MKRVKVEGEKSRQVLRLDVGGREMVVTRSVLTEKYPDSELAKIATSQNQETTLFVDTDPDLFLHILQYLRRSLAFESVPIGITPEVWYAEVKHWHLPLVEKKLSPNLNSFMAEKKKATLQRLSETLTDILKMFGQDDKIVNGNTDLDISIPCGIFQTNWGADLYGYLKESSEVIKEVYRMDKSCQNGFYIWVAECLPETKKSSYSYSINNTKYETMTTPTFKLRMSICYR